MGKTLEITSLQHPIVKHLKKLREVARYRKENKTLLLEGLKPIAEICSYIPAIRILYTEDVKIPTSVLTNERILVPEQIISKISGMEQPEGILAEVPCPEWSDLAGKNWIVACAGVADPGNMGTIIRSALAFGWEGVLLLENCVDPFNEKVIRASRGAIFHVPLMQGTWSHLFKISVAAGLTVLAADTKGIPFDEAKIKEGCMLILGNEARGVKNIPNQILKVTIPMSDQAESLNVAIAGGILMQAFRHRS